jgi:hypothetical protein
MSIDSSFSSSATIICWSDSPSSSESRPSFYYSYHPKRGTDIVVSRLVLVLSGTARLRNSRLRKSLASLPRTATYEPLCGPQLPEYTLCVAGENLDPYRLAGLSVSRHTARTNPSSSICGFPEASYNIGNGKNACELQMSKSNAGLFTDSLLSNPDSFSISLDLNDTSERSAFQIRFRSRTIHQERKLTSSFWVA